MIGTNIRDQTRLLKSSVALAAIIGVTIALKREGRLHVGRCPFHGERTPSFKVYPEHYHCFGCGARGDVFTWLMQTHHISFAEAVAHLSGSGRRLYVETSPRRDALTNSAEFHAAGATDEAGRVERARGIWCEAVDPQGTPVETYLEHRSVRMPDAHVIRFHPHCPRKGCAQQAMVALMVDPLSGDPCGIHRTFLKPDGSGHTGKMMLGKAGTIRLVDLENIGIGIGLAEGLETALTVMQRIGWGPVWAATSAGAIRSFPVLRATTLNIFADHDAAGLAAAHECAERWLTAGQEALIHIPPDGEDWADAAERLAP